MNTPSAERDELLESHPTPKPVAMLQEASLDVTARDEIVLDPFAGSGSVFLAAGNCERRAYALELDPLYVDVALRRFLKSTGIDPVRTSDNRTLSDLLDQEDA